MISWKWLIISAIFLLSAMLSSHGGVFKAVSARIGSSWKKFEKLSEVLIGKQGLPLKQRRKIYRCCAWPVLLYFSETWELSVAGKVRLREVKCHKRMMCGVRLLDRASSVDLCHRELVWVGQLKN